MVQLTDMPQHPAPAPSSNSSVFDGMPVPQASHNYDRERDVSTTRTTLEYPGGKCLIVTTTVEVRLKHPHGYTVAATQDDASNVAAASDEEDDNNPPSAPAMDLPAYHVPLPTSFVHPENEDFKRFHVVFAGKQVGIFPGEWEDVVAPLVKGVPYNRTEGYGSFDDAVYQYARAYQGKRKGWRVRVIGSPVRVEYDDNYQWGDGEMLGSVDITGLNISRELVTTVA